MARGADETVEIIEIQELGVARWWYEGLMPLLVRNCWIPGLSSSLIWITEEPNYFRIETNFGMMDPFHCAVLRKVPRYLVLFHPVISGL